jgi:hypothetical protein
MNVIILPSRGTSLSYLSRSLKRDESLLPSRHNRTNSRQTRLGVPEVREDLSMSTDQFRWDTKHTDTHYLSFFFFSAPPKDPSYDDIMKLMNNKKKEEAEMMAKLKAAGINTDNLNFGSRSENHTR